MTERSAKASVTSDELALNGGPPIRTEPLPLEFPGGHYIDAEEIEAVTDVLTRRSPFRYYGFTETKRVDLLEEEFAAYCQRRYALGISSGTAALSVSLAAMAVGPGQEVLVPGYMWVSTISAIVRAGAIPVLVDLDETFCMDPDDLRKKITPKSTVVLVVHMSGAPGRLDEIMATAREHNLKVLADCAQACGSSFNGKPIGKYGDMAIFSFQLNKNMTTGEGGMLVCDDKHLYDRAFGCHDMGYARDNEGRLDTNNEQYQLWGHGCRMTEIVGAMGRVQLRKLPRIVAAMRQAKYRIREGIADIPGLRLREIIDPEGDSGPFMITIYPNKELCRKFVAALRAEGIVAPEIGINNIPMSEWSLHLYNVNNSLINKTSNSPDGYPWTHSANVDSDYDYHYGALPQMDDMFSRSALLAIPSVLTDKDIDDVVRAYHKVASHISLR